MHSLIAAGPVSTSGPWSLGTLIGFPVAVLLTVVLPVVAAVVLARWHRRNRHDYDSGAALGLAVVLSVFAVVDVITIASPAGMYPYDSEYHQWRSVSGEVQDVSSRLIGGDKTVSQRFVVKIDGQAFGVDDTRASLLKKGDTVSLRCKREWQYAAESGWACRWGGTR